MAEIRRRSQERLKSRTQRGIAARQPRMRIIQVIDHLGPGGAQRQFVELATGLHALGHSVLVCALSDTQREFLTPLEDAGIQCQLIPQSGKLDRAAYKALYQLIVGFEPDVVQSWLYTADMYARPAAWWAGRKQNKACSVVSSVRSAETDKRAHYVWVDRALRPITDAFIVNAKILADTLVQREWVDRNLINTIYNGINTDYFSESKRCPHKGDGTFTIGFIGRLSQEKRPELFVSAAAIAARKSSMDLQFHMIGSGDSESLLQQGRDQGLASRLTIDAFSDDVVSVLSRYDLIVNCSNYEGCSNTLLEAMAAGVPALATAVGGNPELIGDDYGWLCEPNNADALAEAMLQASDEHAEREHRARLAKGRVLSDFSKLAMVKAHVELYERLRTGEIK